MKSGMPFASGVAWQGLKEIYRESIAARAPETATFTVRVPERAWLDLAVVSRERARGAPARARLLHGLGALGLVGAALVVALGW